MTAQIDFAIRAAITTSLRAGASYAEVADRHAVSLSFVSRLARSLPDLPRRGRGWKQPGRGGRGGRGPGARTQRILELLARGEEPEQIASRLGVTTRSVSIARHKYGREEAA